MASVAVCGLILRRLDIALTRFWKRWKRPRAALCSRTTRSARVSGGLSRWRSCCAALRSAAFSSRSPLTEP